MKSVRAACAATALLLAGTLSGEAADQRLAASALAGVNLPDAAISWKDDPDGSKGAEIEMAGSLVARNCTSREYLVWPAADTKSVNALRDRTDAAFVKAGWSFNVVSRSDDGRRLYLAGRGTKELIMDWLPVDKQLGLLLCITDHARVVPAVDAAPVGTTARADPATAPATASPPPSPSATPAAGAAKTTAANDGDKPGKVTTRSIGPATDGPPPAAAPPTDAVTMVKVRSVAATLTPDPPAPATATTPSTAIVAPDPAPAAKTRDFAPDAAAPAAATGGSAAQVDGPPPGRAAPPAPAPDAKRIVALAAPTAARAVDPVIASTTPSPRDGLAGASSGIVGAAYAMTTAGNAPSGDAKSGDLAAQRERNLASAALRTRLMQTEIWSLMLAGLGLLAASFKRRAPDADLFPWPTTVATILETKVEAETEIDETGSIVTWYVPIVNYHYEVGGKDRFGTRVHGGDQRVWTRAEAEHMVARYPICAGIEISYDPSDPDYAVIEVPKTPADPRLPLGLLCLGSGVAATLIATL